MILGTISAVDSYDGITLVIDGEDVATTKKYSYISSYSPTVNDRVIIEEIGGSYVILGKIITDVASSGIAREALSAVSAQNATNADACSGNAATSTVSNTTKGFDSSVGSDNGYLVTRVYTTYSSQLGTNIVTGVDLTYNARNFVYK